MEFSVFRMVITTARAQYKKLPTTCCTCSFTFLSSELLSISTQISCDFPYIGQLQAYMDNAVGVLMLCA